jgi:phosphoenolpyruvate-protein phosphotransferase (PTS system enzyme I)
VPFTLHGIPVSRGIAIGRAHVIAPAALEVEHYLIEADAIESEVTRLQQAHQMVLDELAQLRSELPKDAPEEMAAFLDVHAMILNDSMLRDEPLRLIRSQHYNAEWALMTQLDELVRQFEEIEDPYLRERKGDIQQVVERVLKVLICGERAGSIPALLAGQDHITEDHKSETNLIVVARDIAPADMLQFKTHRFGGFITDVGGKTSHTAIVARSLDIPAAVGVNHASTLIKQSDLLIIDGDEGVVIVAPTEIILEEYQHKQNQGLLDKKKLNLLRSTSTKTLDDVEIKLLANIELPIDAEFALQAGAHGVGLFRSEFLFMNRHNQLPDEEEQFLAYSAAVNSMKGLPVTIRTIDVGADKPLDSHHSHNTTLNPALGLRAIRWSLSEPEMFITQLRAIFRASVLGPVKVLIPMLSSSQEIEQTMSLIAQVRDELDRDGFGFDPRIKIGAMIEVPAAALAVSMFICSMDFLSIGTNDLIQYTLAIDRADSAVAHLYDPLHPAVLFLIENTIRAGKNGGIPVSVCGEMAGDPTMTRLLLAFGLREFSMHPSQLLRVKQEIIRADIGRLKDIGKMILNTTDAKQLKFLLKELQSA